MIPRELINALRVAIAAELSEYATSWAPLEETETAVEWEFITIKSVNGKRYKIRLEEL